MNDSFAPVPTIDVIAMCNDLIQHITDYKQERRQKIIHAMVAKDQNSWWRKFLWERPAITYQEAESMYWAEWKISAFHPEDVIRMYAGKSKQIAERLLALSGKTQSDTMIITAKDMEHIR